MCSDRYADEKKHRTMVVLTTTVAVAWRNGDVRRGSVAQEISPRVFSLNGILLAQQVRRSRQSHRNFHYVGGWSTKRELFLAARDICVWFFVNFCARKRPENHFHSLGSHAWMMMIWMISSKHNLKKYLHFELSEVNRFKRKISTKCGSKLAMEKWWKMKRRKMETEFFFFCQFEWTFVLLMEDNNLIYSVVTATAAWNWRNH